MTSKELRLRTVLGYVTHVEIILLVLAFIFMLMSRVNQLLARAFDVPQ